MSERSAIQRLVNEHRALNTKEHREAWWRCLTDAQRWHLFANCCWNCGAMDPTVCKCSV